MSGWWMVASSSEAQAVPYFLLSLVFIYLFCFLINRKKKKKQNDVDKSLNSSLPRIYLFISFLNK